MLKIMYDLSFQILVSFVPVVVCVTSCFVGVFCVCQEGKTPLDYLPQGHAVENLLESANLFLQETDPRMLLVEQGLVKHCWIKRVEGRTESMGLRSYL